jgi:hypothetical protein
MSSGQPQLYRQETDLSKSDAGTLDQEKAGYDHRENVNVPQTIAEGDEDTGGNVGTAEYEKSKLMAEIVSLDGVRRLIGDTVVDARDLVFRAWQTPAQNKAILRRIDWFILPLFLMTQ